MSYDVIVAGGGHNGLVCAAHARPGRPPRRRPRAPRARRRHPRRRRLDRRPAAAGRRRGARARAPRPRAGAPGRPHAGAARDRGAPLTFWADRGPRPREELAAVSPEDADAYPRFDAHVRVLARFLGELADVDAAAARRRRGRRLAGGPEARPRLSAPQRPRRPRVHPGAADGRRRLRGRVVRVRCRARRRWPPGARCSPRWARGRPAPRCVLLADSAGNDGGAAGQTTYARGGPTALASALEAAATAAGAEVRTGAEVSRLLVRGGAGRRASRLASGEEIEAPVVACGVDPKTVLTRWLDPEEAGPRLQLARREHPHAGRDRRRRAAPVGSSRVHRRRRSRAAVAGGSSSRRGSTTSSGPSTAGSTAR